jgi:hypothetical protein
MFDVLKKTIDGISTDYSTVGQVSNLSKMVAVIINILLGVTSALSIVGIAFSFFLFVMSAGDKDAVKKAKTSLTWSVVVLLLCFFVMVLKKSLFSLLGVNSSYNDNFVY